MSQQINLYDPALLKKRELLTVTNVAVLSVILLLAVGGWGFSARMQMAKLVTESQDLGPKVKSLQEQLIEVGKQLASARPDPRLEAELTSSRNTLALRGEIIAALKKGVGGGAAGYGEYLRGLARQSPSGLWLTGFRVGENGTAMEIHGRMLDPALLPEYIRRLSSEPAFKGRAFATLKVSTPAAATATGQAGAAVTPAVTAPFLEFMLIPERSNIPTELAANNAPIKLADLLPPEAARALEGKR